MLEVPRSERDATSVETRPPTTNAFPHHVRLRPVLAVLTPSHLFSNIFIAFLVLQNITSPIGLVLKSSLPGNSYYATLGNTFSVIYLEF